MGSNMNPKQQLLAQLKELIERLVTDPSSVAQVETLTTIISSLENEGTAAVFDQRNQSIDSQFNIYINQIETSIPGTNRHIYLNYIRNRCENIPLRGLGLTSTISNPNLVRNQRMRLSRIFIDLETTTMEEEIVRDEWSEELNQWGFSGEPTQTKPIPVLEAVIRSRLFLLLGGPGSGKTTFIRYLALCLASIQIEKTKDWILTLPNWTIEDLNLIPVVVNLRDFSRWLKRRSAKGSANLFWQFLEEDIENIVHGFFPEIQQDIYNGKAMLLLDGLDEVEISKQQVITDSIINLSEICEARIITTCRALSFKDPKWQLNGFEHYELASLSSLKIKQFINLWYEELVQNGSISNLDANEFRMRFQKSLEQNQDLWNMASNPLLLETMALIHTHEGFLPQNRALLYEDCVDLLLWNWEELKIPIGAVTEPTGIRPLLQQVGLQEIDFKQTFWKIAYELFKNNHEEIEIQDILKAFSNLHPDHDWNWAKKIVIAIQERAGLIVEHVEGKFSFPHRTFQEFLAASYLASLPDFANIAAELAINDKWHEVILLAIGRTLHISGDTSKPLNLIAEMLLRDDILETPEYGLFASELLAEIGTQRIRETKLGQSLLDKSVSLLSDWLNTSVLNSRNCKRLGITLSLLGDPRFDSKKLFLPKRLLSEEDERLFGFVLIPGDKYFIGPSENLYSITISDYFISRYPVTEAQYWQFIQETNRNLPPHWINGRPLPQRLNCPMVYVNWYDALAYCRWLSRRIGNLDLTNEQKKWWESTTKLILLPTETEWEIACRGNSANKYAWGNNYESRKGNTNEENLGESISVGLFPTGKSNNLIMDLGGNIREWTTTRYWDENKNKYGLPYNKNDGREDLSRDDNVTRVLKGGSYNLDHICSMCNYRTKNFPVDRHPYIGFRIVIHLR